MKLLMMMFVCVCLNNPPQTDSVKQKKGSAPKKEKRASINLAPSILINF
jgi:hypothetical protein